jgi:predicted transcriptional regulator
MERRLRALIVQEGYTKVYNEFMEQCKKYYEYLQTCKHDIEPVKNVEEVVEEVVGEVKENSEEEKKEKRVWPFFGKNVKRKERKKELITKDNFTKLIEEGKGYTTIAKEVGISYTQVRKYCEKYGIDKSKPAKKYESRKEIPDDYKEIVENAEKREEKHKKCCEEIKRKNVGDIHELSEEIGIYGIFSKKTNEIIYIGSTDNFVRRYTMHKEKYEEGQKQLLFEKIKERGGWENHVMIPLEKREDEKGLYIIETIWWESVKPIGNKVSPCAI